MEVMNFYEKVYEQVQAIPRGKVSTYGLIAAKISTPRAARAVGFALRRLPEDSDVPWWRVLNKSGRISIQNMTHPSEEQAALLKAEGIKILAENSQFCVDLGVYLAD